MGSQLMTFAKFDAQRQQRYLGCIAGGMRLGEAAKASGVSAYLVNEYCKAHPDFLEARNQAEAQACDKVEAVLFNKCMEGNMTAIVFWLLNRSFGRWEDKRNAKPQQQQTDDAIMKAILGRLTQKKED